VKKKELAASVAGGAVAAGILAAEHYLMKREYLSRTRAYMAGIAGLDIGQLIYWQLNGQRATPVGAALVQLIGGGTVIATYRRDRSQRAGQLQEALNRVRELEVQLLAQSGQMAELEQELAARPVKASELGLVHAQLRTALEDLDKSVHVATTALGGIATIMHRLQSSNAKKYRSK
jgi:hypothetical protein